jgi:hypothetical protein
MNRPDTPIPALPNEARSTQDGHLRTAAQIFITCLLVYLLAYSGKQYSIDGIVMFQYAKAILFDHSWTMHPPVQWGIEFPVSKWPIGLTLAYIPLLALLAQTFFRLDPQIRQIPYNPDLDFNLELIENRPYLYSAILNPLLTATSAAVLFAVCLRLGTGRRRAAAIALVYGLASPAAVYAKLDFAQPLAALLLLLAFYFLLRAREEGLRMAAGAGLSYGALVLTRPELVLLAPLLAGFLFFSTKPASPSSEKNRDPWIQLLGFGLPLLGFFVLNGAINALRFGSWFSFGYSPGSEFTLAPARILTALAGNLASPGRGILFFFPLSILALAGLRRLRGTHPLFAWTLAAYLAGSLILYSAWKDWGAGISWGPRFFIPLVPYLALLGLINPGGPHPRRRSKLPLLVSLLVVLGGIAALQGLLFNFVDFYTDFNLPPAVVDRGDYNFSFLNSPIFRGWELLARPREYDIFWLEERVVVLSEVNMVLIPALALLALGTLAWAWVQFFRER